MFQCRGFTLRSLALFLPLTVAFVACDSTSTTYPAPDEVFAGINPVAEDGSCVVEDGTFDDNVALPVNASCTFTNVIIQGNLKMNRGSLLAAEAIDVDGNLQAQQAAGLTLTESEIHGDIQFEDGGFVEIQAVYIDGNLQLDANRESLTARENVIKGNLQVFQNQGGAFLFSDNTIDGNLQCKENAPAPEGSGNVVEGNREDQCEGF